MAFVNELSIWQSSSVEFYDFTFLKIAFFLLISQNWKYTLTDSEKHNVMPSYYVIIILTLMRHIVVFSVNKFGNAGNIYRLMLAKIYRS